MHNYNLENQLALNLLCLLALSSFIIAFSSWNLSSYHHFFRCSICYTFHLWGYCFLRYWGCWRWSGGGQFLSWPLASGETYEMFPASGGTCEMSPVRRLRLHSLPTFWRRAAHPASSFFCKFSSNRRGLAVTFISLFGKASSSLRSRRRIYLLVLDC